MNKLGNYSNITSPKGEYRSRADSYEVKTQASSRETNSGSHEIVLISSCSAESITIEYNTKERSLRKLLKAINTK